MLQELIKGALVEKQTWKLFCLSFGFSLCATALLSNNKRISILNPYNSFEVVRFSSYWYSSAELEPLWNSSAVKLVHCSQMGRLFLGKGGHKSIWIYSKWILRDNSEGNRDGASVKRGSIGFWLCSLQESSKESDCIGVSKEHQKRVTANSPKAAGDL